MQEDKETYRQRHEDTTADMKTWMLTKCRQTTELNEKNSFADICYLEMRMAMNDSELLL